MKAKIQVILPTAKHLHRQILEGILAYGRLHGPWQFHLETGFADNQTIGKGRQWGCKGIIAMVSEAKHLNALQRTGLPTVFINPPTVCDRKRKPKPPTHVTYVVRNQEEIGRTAAEYFLDRGFRSFAIVNVVENSAWCRRRQIGYEERLAEAGFSCRAYVPTVDDSGTDFNRESKRLSEWLLDLPPDTALYAVRDRRALQVLGLCQDCNITVPDTLSVLGTDNDDVLCEAVSPTLSSIALDGESVGNLCAKLLDQRLRGRRTASFVELPLPHVVTRQSTDATKHADPFIAVALKIVHADLAGSHTLENLAKRIGISKRSLEMKANLVLGHTLRTEIERIRLNEAMRLRTNTDLSLLEIAEHCGFCSASYLLLRLKTVFGK